MPRSEALRWLCLLIVAASPALAAADPYDGLKIVDNPGGGQIVYGPLPGESSLPGAMGSILRRVHGHFGDRPQIGKFFHARGTDSVATFFTLSAKSQGGANMAGMVMVSLPLGGKPTAVALYDEAGRLAKTLPSMLNTLNQSWQNSPTPAVAGPGGAVPPLRNYTGGDSSASVGLPAGWKITGVGGGALSAAGPNGEMITLGLIIQNIYDIRNPQARGMVDYMKKGTVPFIVCPIGGDLGAAFLCVTPQNRKNQHLPPAQFHVVSSHPVPPGPYETQAAIATADMDLMDGKPPLMVNMRLGAMKGGTAGGWAMTYTGETVPKHLVAEEWPTIMAIVASYRQNGKVIWAETKAVIDNINATAAANRRLADATSAAHDAHNRAVEAYWDDNAKRNKAFENYQMDRTVIQDNELNGHLTTGYAFGDALVRSDPTRFQYVPTQDFLKGIDY